MFFNKKPLKTSILKDCGKNPKKDLYFRIINARMILHYKRNKYIMLLQVDGGLAEAYYYKTVAQSIGGTKSAF